MLVLKGARQLQTTGYGNTHASLSDFCTQVHLTTILRVLAVYANHVCIYAMAVVKCLNNSSVEAIKVRILKVALYLEDVLDSSS